MALIACPECRRRISEAAESCPNCGYTRTLEEVTKIKEIRKKRSKWIIGFLAFLASFVVIAILVDLYSRKSTTAETWQEPVKSSMDRSTYSSQPDPPNTIETQPPSVPIMSVTKTSERPETAETQQEQPAADEAWLGTWSLESINGEPTAANLALGLGYDIFVSWNYTFYAYGRFESKLRQDTGNGIITTTIYGTYEVSGNRYNIVRKEATMCIGRTSVAIPDITNYQSGTWSRIGDILIMIPIGSATKVFKILETPQTLSPAKVWTGDDQKTHPLKQVFPKYPEDARENLQTTPPTEVSTKYDEKPRVLSQVHPKYPKSARRAMREGFVTLEFTVGVDGKAADIKVVRSMIGFGFDEAAIEAVKKWRFTPAKKGGEAVPSRVKLPIRFNLE